MTRLPNLYWPQVGRGYIFTAVVFLFFLSWPYIDDPPQQHREVSPRADSLYTLASDHFDAGNYDSAAACYGQIFSEDSTENIALTNRAMSHCLNGAFEEALADCERALLIDSFHAPAYGVMGLTYYELGRYQSAVDELTVSLRIDPTVPEMWENRADAYRELGDFDQAIADYLKAIDLPWDNAERHNKLGACLLEDEQYELALTHLNVAIARDSTEGYFFYNRGMAYLHMDQHAEAIRDLQHCLRMLDDDPDIFFSLAQCHDLAKHPDSAVHYYLKYVDGARPSDSEYVRDVRGRIEELNTR